MDMTNYFSTGEFAKLIGVTSATLRVWDKSGKLKPVHKSENGYRYYSKEQVAQYLNLENEILSVDTSESYFLSCWECGALIPKITKTTFNRVMCDECKTQYEERKIKTLNEYIKLKIEVMYERALRIMEKSEKVNMAEIEEAAKVVYEHAKKDPNAFDSSQEMITAIMLINNRIKIKMQHKVNNHRLDIYIKEWNCGVEVDGKLHEGKELRDSKRDIAIREELGKGFEIIRIPTKYIESNPMKIVDYIKESYKNKKELRAKYNGILPDNYSKREKEMYNKVLNKKIFFHR